MQNAKDSCHFVRGDSTVENAVVFSYCLFTVSMFFCGSAHAVFHDCHRESPECKLNYFSTSAWDFNVNLLKVFVPHFMRINC